MLRLKPVLSMIAAAALLAGCGRAATPTAPVVVSTSRALLSADEAIGLPSSYRPGVSYPGMPNTPAFLKASFPRFTRTFKGVSGDPVNLLLVGDEAVVRGLFRQAGWLEADPTNAVTAARMVKAMLTHGSYPTAPMSDLYLYNRKQDMALQKNSMSIHARDHLRVWRSSLQDPTGRTVWAVAATKDVSIKMGFDDTLPTHQISPNIDAERLLVVNDFVRSGQVKMRYQLQSLPKGYRGQNGCNDEFYTDGLTEVLELGSR